MMARSAEEVEGARLQTQSVENPHEQRFAAPHLPARARGHTHTTALRGEVIEVLGTRNFREICLSDSRFAYKKFAYVRKEIPVWAKCLALGCA